MYDVGEIILTTLLPQPLRIVYLSIVKQVIPFYISNYYLSSPTWLKHFLYCSSFLTYAPLEYRKIDTDINILTESHLIHVLIDKTTVPCTIKRRVT